MWVAAMDFMKAFVTKLSGTHLENIRPVNSTFAY